MNILVLLRDILRHLEKLPIMSDFGKIWALDF